MVKEKSKWVWNSCGAIQSKWSGACFSCREWDTLEQHFDVQEHAKVDMKALNQAKPTLIQDVQMSGEERISSDIEELDHLLGGGAVRGGLTLLGGAPGIGF